MAKRTSEDRQRSKRKKTEGEKKNLAEAKARTPKERGEYQARKNIGGGIAIVEKSEEQERTARQEKAQRETVGDVTSRRVTATGEEMPVDMPLEQRQKIISGEEMTPKRQKEIEEELTAKAEEEGVFEEPTVEPIISPEQENLTVVGRVLKGMVPEGSLKDKFMTNIFGGRSIKSIEKKPLSQVEITTIEEDVKEFIEIETSAQIDSRIVDAEGTIISIGLIPPEVLPDIKKEVSLLGVAGTVGGIVGAEAVTRPFTKFVGTDEQIQSLELTLSQYNEMLTIPSRGVTSGRLSPEAAFDKYDRMEQGILILEQQLHLSALESPSVALSLKGRAVEARLLKLKEKVQEGRRVTFNRMAQEAYGEVDIAKSTAFLRRLQDDNKK